MIFSQPIPEPIICPHCGREVEIFTNEQVMKCYFCGGLVTREKRMTCLDWCKYADKCLADIENARRQNRAKAEPTCPEPEAAPRRQR
jgi:hypothetical protein